MLSKDSERGEKKNQYVGIYAFYKFSFFIWETTRETSNVSLMKPIKTFHQSLTRGFDTKKDELNYELDIVRVNNSACLSDLKRARNLFFAASWTWRTKQTINICHHPYGGDPLGGRG